MNPKDLEPQKVYWSQEWSQEWTRETWLESQWMTFFLVPNKWWSISEWRLAFSFRNEALKKIMSTMGGSK